MQWFRLYAEMLNDPKIQGLPDNLYKIWINSLCIACNNNGTLPPISDCGFLLRLAFHETKMAFHDLKNLGLFETVGETFQIKNWNKRQYKSDTSTDRVKQHRRRLRNVSVTPPDTDTDTEQNRTDKKRLTPKKPEKVSAEIWGDFLRQRKTKFSITALEGIEREVTKAGISLEEGLRTAVERGWQSFKSEWIKEGKQNGKTKLKQQAITLLGDIRSGKFS